MGWADRLIIASRSVFRRQRVEHELDAELQFHVQQQIDENIAAGMSLDEARRSASRSLGSVPRIREQWQDSLGLTFIDNLHQDVRYAVRAFRKSPAFAATAILTLALGVGANAAVFSVVNAVLLRPLPYHDPDRIVTLASSVANQPLGFLHGLISRLDFRDWQAQSTAFEAMAYYGGRQTAVTIGSAAEYARVIRVSPDFFRVFDVQPLLGRLFSVDEEKPGGSGAAVVSDAFAEQYFGGSERALGQTIRVFDRVVSIVGVLPSRFNFPAATDIWFPDDAIPDRTWTSRSAQNRLAVGRLKDEVTIDRAREEMTTIAARLQQQYPTSNKDRGVTVTLLHDDMVEHVGLMLWLLLAAVGVVLVIVCANLATLLPAAFLQRQSLNLVLRSTVDPTALTEAVRRKAYELSPEVPVKFTTMEALLAEHVAAPRFRALLVGLFAAVALSLAIVGIFGVMVYVVTQRTTEIGLRMALGATSADVLWLLLKRGLVMTGIGLAAGLVVTRGLATPFLASLLFDVKPTDAATYVAVAGLLGLTSLVATYIPSRRSARIEPLVALRHE
jgi:hypothetical protein